MDWKETPESTNIARFRYDEDNQVLHVEFNNGGSYRYFDVPEHIVQEMESAGSKGRFLAERIKGYYRYARD